MQNFTFTRPAQGASVYLAGSQRLSALTFYSLADYVTLILKQTHFPSFPGAKRLIHDFTISLGEDLD